MCVATELDEEKIQSMDISNNYWWEINLPGLTLNILFTGLDFCFVCMNWKAILSSY